MPAALVSLAAAVSVRAAEPGYQISVGVMETDNVQRLPHGGTSDTLFDQEASLTWHERRPVLAADIDADVSHVTYVPRTYKDQVVGNFIGNARLSFVPQVFSWDFSDNFGQGTIDPFATLTPANRELINYFSTGPQLAVPLSATNFLALSASYGKVSYETSPLDSNRYSGTVGILHQLSSRSSLSFNVHDERIDYTDHVANNTNYDSQAAYLRLDAHGNRTVLDADVGYGRLRRDGSSPSTVIAHLEITRRVSASSYLAAYLGHEYSDAAESFRLTQTIGGANLNTQPTLQTATPFKSDYVTLAWNFSRNRTSWGLSASDYKDTYEQGGGLNDNRAQFAGHFTRRLTPTLEATVTEDYLRQHFDNTTGSYSQSTTTLDLLWRVGRRVSFALDYSHSRRQSNLPDTNFSENRVRLSVGYGRPAQVPPGPATPPLLHATQY